MIDTDVIEMTEGLRSLLIERITEEVKKSGGRVDIEVFLPVIDALDDLAMEKLIGVTIKEGVAYVIGQEEYTYSNFQASLGEYSVDELIRIFDAL